MNRVRSRGFRVAGPAILLAALMTCCTSSSPATSSATSSATLRVVAAENTWGSIASQLGGNRVAVSSLVSRPDADPHSYEPTAADGRTVATARYVIVNGIGYDPWAPKLLAAQPSPGRRVLTVGDLVRVTAGGNPHRWYSPSDVTAVINRITADYQALDPADATYFDEQHSRYLTTALADYSQLINDIRAKYAGTPVGASESIAAPLAEALGLHLLTPPSFLQAISAGTDPTAADKATIDNQIKNHQIKTYLFNSQNSTPDVAAQVGEARAAGIPVTTITETLAPPGASFQAWQVSQLQALQLALSQATGG